MKYRIVKNGLGSISVEVFKLIGIYSQKRWVWEQTVKTLNEGLLYIHKREEEKKVFDERLKLSLEKEVLYEEIDSDDGED